MDVEPYHDPGETLGHQPETAVLHQRDAAGFEIGRIDRVVDIADWDRDRQNEHCPTAGTENLRAAGLNRGGPVHSRGRSPKFHAVTAQLSNCGKGLPGSLAPYYAFPRSAALARQAQPKAPGPTAGSTEKKSR